MHPLIRNYFKNGCLNKSDRLLAFLFSNIGYSINANKIVNLFNQTVNHHKTNLEKVYITIDDYPFNNKQVIELGIFLQRNLKEDLAGAYVHGSAGTNELVAYSDLDALVIIKDEVFKDANRIREVALKLKEAENYMYQLDPLQHHGWFVLSESDLIQYDNSYLPAELLPFSKSILLNGIKNIELLVNKENKTDTTFEDVCKSVIRKIAKFECPSTLYELKNLLSEFMLLPSLYVQARDGKSVFKKFSFDIARADFEKQDWEIMNEVSAIRKNWNQKQVSRVSERIAARLSPIKIIANLFRAQTPELLKKQINSDFLLRMNLLATSMRTKIDHRN